MLRRLKEQIKGKKVLILGFGREGRSTLRRILEVGGYRALAIADQRAADPEAEIPFLSGAHYMDTLDDYDLVFKSPGIVLPEDPSSYRCRVTSQMELFLEEYGARTIGVTGTKGKSTTTTLLYHILQEAGRDVVLAGNIGIPAFDILEKIGPETVPVCEFSCHQLEYIHVSPHIAILLNIHEEHLDHYGSFERYAASKHQIYLHQKAGDLLFCGADVLPENGTCQADIFSVSDHDDNAAVRLDGTQISFAGRSYQIPTEGFHMLGHHNHLDVAFAYAICCVMGLSNEEFDRSLRSYEPLPHRLRFIGERDGVRYYDDSISTIGDTAIQALKSVPSVGTILIGGMDRGIDYDDLIEFLANHPVPHIILMYATGRRILDEIREQYPDFPGQERLLYAETLTEAVAQARALTRPGEACVLSPAAASYGIFKNFEERGDVFRELVFS
ncbi:MAG: UDP-N-acetylmuramoyl-L-alanine--D-glutamate ligase [Lachnospiraceae bacterium]|nr:UDP-N-acetylmuramoyl-L-alanine--D-glutamate ligase [Lachnospiraceae bacterium]